MSAAAVGQTRTLNYCVEHGCPISAATMQLYNQNKADKAAKKALHTNMQYLQILLGLVVALHNDPGEQDTVFCLAAGGFYMASAIERQLSAEIDTRDLGNRDSDTDHNTAESGQEGSEVADDDAEGGVTESNVSVSSSDDSPGSSDDSDDSAGSSDDDEVL